MKTSLFLQIIGLSVSFKTVLKTEERSQQPVRVQALVLVMVPECLQLMEIITLTGHGKLKSLYVYWSLQNSKYCAVLLGKEFFCLVVFL